jgi:serine/threonine protein kinase
LKPENVLIDNEGYAVIADFGLAASGPETKNKTLKECCGTNEYISPEMLKRKPYGKEVDFWTLGCFIFEILCGFPPFLAKSNEEMKE